MDRESMRKKLAEQRAVEDHWLNGGEVVCSVNEVDWVMAPAPVFEWHRFHYRIKPQPMERWVAMLGETIVGWFQSKDAAVREVANTQHPQNYRIVHMLEVTE